MPAKISNDQFLHLVEARNATLPPIKPLELYKGRHTKILFQCHAGHQYLTTPNNALRSSGCLVCSGKGAKTHKQFVDELAALNEIRDRKVYVDDGSTYTDAFTQMTFVCDLGHKWVTTPSNIINSKHTCRTCAGKVKKSHSQFVQEMKTARPDVSIKEGQTYITAHTKMSFVCEKQHVWEARPVDLLLGGGCPHCVKKGYSRKCVNWLKSIEAQTGCRIQHAEQGGEFLIPDTPFYADGWCRETNTVYEFYGDVYHGNPTLFSEGDRCHPYNKQITAGTLYRRTLEREQQIRDLGYNVVSIWESEYDKLV